MLRRSIAALVGGLLVASAPPASAAPTSTAPAPVAVAQVLTWTADNDITRYRTAPAAAVAGAATLVFENSEATGNTTGMPHTLTFDTETPGYNHDVAVDVLANPFDSANGRHQVDVVLTPGKYRYHCTIPGHGTMVGELVVTAGGGGEDTTPPVVSAEVAGDRNADGDYLGEATVTASASDAQSGVASIEYQVDDAGFETYTGPVRVTAVGDHAVQYRATDGAGNVSAVGSTAFRVVERPAEDTTPPAVAAEVTGERNASGQYLGKATATITATDAGSGVRTTEYTLDGGPWTPYTAPVEVTAPGAHMIHHRATDNAGNTSPEGMSAFTVVAAPVEDTTPPTVTGTVTGQRDADGNYLGVATVTITASDDGSGVAVVEHAVDGGAWTRHTAPVVVRAQGAHSVRYRATDGAGNTAPEKSLSFSVVAPGQDACPDSDTRATVVIGDDDTGVANTDTGNGCTVSDLVDQHGDHVDHGAFVRHVERVTGDLVARGLLTRREQGVLVRAASRSDIGNQTRPHPAGRTTMARRTAPVLATLSIVAASAVFAPTAHAGLVTHCVGSGGAVTVPNDLLVPAGESCSLDGTTITGDVQVAAGANLVVAGGTVNGAVRVAADGYLDLTDTRVDGQVVLAPGGFGVFLGNSDTGRVLVEPKGSAAAEGFLYVEGGSAIDGDVTVGAGEVSLVDSEVTGDVGTNGAYFTDLHGTFVDGTLSVLNNATGSVVCGGAVLGKATFAGSLGGIQLGPNGALDTCASGGYFARDVVISNTTGRTTLDDNVVNGTLRLSANAPVAEVAANNRVRGGITGDHTATTAAARASAVAADGTRGTAGRRAGDREASALVEAAAHGPARL